MVVDEDIIKLMNYWRNVLISWIKGKYKWNNINGFSTQPPINTFLHLFDHIIKPIALYGCEIWGTLTSGIQEKDKHLYDNFKTWEVENLNIKFCKYLLGAGEKAQILQLYLNWVDIICIFQ